MNDASYIRAELEAIAPEAFDFEVHNGVLHWGFRTGGGQKIGVVMPNPPMSDDDVVGAIIEEAGSLKLRRDHEARMREKVKP